MNITEEFERMRLKGFAQYCDLKIKAIEEDYAVCEMDISDSHLNPMGFAHGGVLFTLMDTTSGCLARYKTGFERKSVTTSSNISFLKPVYAGHIECRAEFIKYGKSISVISSEVYNANNEKCAFATFEFYYFG